MNLQQFRALLTNVVLINVYFWSKFFRDLRDTMAWSKSEELAEAQLLAKKVRSLWTANITTQTHQQLSKAMQNAS